jgi:hypothetical protein
LQAARLQLTFTVGTPRPAASRRTVHTRPVTRSLATRACVIDRPFPIHRSPGSTGQHHPVSAGTSAGHWPSDISRDHLLGGQRDSTSKAPELWLASSSRYQQVQITARIQTDRLRTVRHLLLPPARQPQAEGRPKVAH